MHVLTELNISNILLNVNLKVELLESSHELWPHEGSKLEFCSPLIEKETVAHLESC